MFAVNWTPKARAQFDALEADADRAAATRGANKKKKSKQEGLFLQVAQALRLSLQDPRHPSLHTHEFTSLEHPCDPKKKVWEAYAQNATPGAYRIFWCYGPSRKEITIIAITPHP